MINQYLFWLIFFTLCSKRTTMKKEIKIFVVGGHRAIAKLMLESLKLRYSDVSHFRNVSECTIALDQKPDILILDDTLKVNKPLDFLEAVNKNTKAHVIYLSKDTQFFHIKKVLSRGAIDFIVNDSCANYAINKSIERILYLSDNLKISITAKDYFHASSIRVRFPRRFALLRMVL
jgi:DNA-binding NtrC family response regulator